MEFIGVLQKYLKEYFKLFSNNLLYIKLLLCTLALFTVLITILVALMGKSSIQECVDAMDFPMATSHDPLLNSHPSQQQHLSCSPKISLKGKWSSRNDSPLKEVRKRHQIQKKVFQESSSSIKHTLEIVKNIEIYVQVNQ